jgi:hypothetical protein
LPQPGAGMSGHVPSRIALGQDQWGPDDKLSELCSEAGTISRW